MCFFCVSFVWVLRWRRRWIRAWMKEGRKRRHGYPGECEAFVGLSWVLLLLCFFVLGAVLEEEADERMDEREEGEGAALSR